MNDMLNWGRFVWGNPKLSTLPFKQSFRSLVPFDLACSSLSFQSWRLGVSFTLAAFTRSAAERVTQWGDWLDRFDRACNFAFLQQFDAICKAEVVFFLCRAALNVSNGGFIPIYVSLCMRRMSSETIFSVDARQRRRLGWQRVWFKRQRERGMQLSAFPLRNQASSSLCLSQRGLEQRAFHFSYLGPVRAD